MCGAYGLSVKDAKEVYDRFDIENTLDSFKPRYNIRPGQLNPIVTSSGDHNEISFMFWGLLPHWARDEKYKYKTINAKVETVAELPSYREPFRKKRCLIPATGFYEPDKLHVSKPPFPWHYFHLKDQPLFAFAGLYDVWKDKQSDKEIYSYTLITTQPNAVVGSVHDRMPVILRKEDEKTWLDPDITEPKELFPLLTQYPAKDMEEWEVGAEARNPRNDYPELLEPVAEAEQGQFIS
ncbi:MAG TPA: SOS response-associated peptidase [Methylomirabilota bacterium]|nr:SOS response-associated peptidase [Methylomirabilota bacterium]